MSLNVQSFDDEHEAFAASRVSQYIYEPSKPDFFEPLDQHADSLETDVRAPLVLLGNEGSGKSACLANWVAKRRESKHKDEFLFQHFVGCSSPSLQLSHTLYRLESALKDFFQLRDVKVPESEYDLRWSLNRFLEAAAKKHFPASRIVIIIDGVNRLKAEGATDGALHWLPTEFPKCVRFILSTVEFQREAKAGKEANSHRTYEELHRRGCSFVRMEPLGVDTRHRVINTFANSFGDNPEMDKLAESQLYKIVASNTSSQPMYLRALLQALRTTSRLTSFSADQVLDMFLACSNTSELIDQHLNLCSEAIFGVDDGEDGAVPDILGKIMSIVYVSRNGLTQEEIWGLIKMVTRIELDAETEAKVMSVVAEFTMVVNDMHSFSHEVYREVVYDKYIRSKEALTRWHFLMARYFGQFIPCARKLVALPYHLEMAGSWSKVKNCLTDIDMFERWWTPAFKKDFIKFWVSLTRKDVNPEDIDDDLNQFSKGKKTKKASRKSTENVIENGSSDGSKDRPTYDIVEEYVYSLDEFRKTKHPSDRFIADIVLKVAEFLLEFARLGHETTADVPSFLHPRLPSCDLMSLGVPHLDERDGQHVLVTPTIFNLLSEDDNTGLSGAEDPERTTYFFRRWMWIQFPYVALGNCNERYSEGIEKAIEHSDGRMAEEIEHERVSSFPKGSKNMVLRKPMSSANANFSKSLNADSFKLPKLKFNRKAGRTVRLLTEAEKKDDAKVQEQKYAARMSGLEDEIIQRREEFDFVCQMKNGMTKQLRDLQGKLEDLKRSEEACLSFEAMLDFAIKNEEEGRKKLASTQSLRKNLGRVMLICERHPANVPALIHEMEEKLEQDIYLVNEIKKRLWKHKFEMIAMDEKYKQMKAIVKEGMEMHAEILNHRIQIRNDLQKKSTDTTKQIASDRHSTKRRSLSNAKSKKGVEELPGPEEAALAVQQGESWHDIWSIIQSRTGIIEPETFFKRFNDRKENADKILHLEKAAEARQEALRNDVENWKNLVEKEKEKNDATFAGEENTKETENDLAAKTQNLKHAKEHSEAAQQLVQRVESGLAHIAEVLGLPHREDEQGDIGELLKEIEGVIEALMEEQEKQQQLQQQQTHGHQTTGEMQSRGFTGTRESLQQNPETHAHRSPELEAILARYEQPKARLPQKLPSCPQDDDLPNFRQPTEEEDEDVFDEEATWDRNYVKGKTMKRIKEEQKRLARIEKQKELAKMEMY